MPAELGEQLQLLPPAHAQVTVTVRLDGPDGSAMVLLDVDWGQPWALDKQEMWSQQTSLEDALELAIGWLTHHVESQRSRLSPF